jgi:hypothetical protein
MSKIFCQELTTTAIGGVLFFFGASLAVADDKFELGKGLNKKFTVRLSSFFASTKTEIRVDSNDGAVGEKISFENDLNLPDRETLPLLDITYRFNPRHMIDFSYVNLGRSATKTFERLGVTTDNIQWTAGAELQSRFESETFRLAYGYSFIHDEKKELGILAGVHLTRFDVKMSGKGSLISVDANGNEVVDVATEGNRKYESGFNVPLPVLGLHGAYALTPKLHVRGWGQFFSLNYEDYDGSLINIAGMLEYDLPKKMGVGLGYTYYGYNLDVDRSNLQGSFEYDFNGPTAFIYAAF